jgi:hypothetical protein
LHLKNRFKECLNLNHNLRSNRALRVETKRRFNKFVDNMFESIGAKLTNKIEIFMIIYLHLKLFYIEILI